MPIPSLQQKAALTLFHNPHMQPEDWSVDYAATGDSWSTPARAIQRWWRRRNRAATRINALMRAFSVRCFISRNFKYAEAINHFLMYGFQPGYLRSVWWEGRDRLISPRNLRSGRRDLARRRDIAERQDTRFYVGRQAIGWFGRTYRPLTLFYVDRWPTRRVEPSNRAERYQSAHLDLRST